MSVKGSRKKHAKRVGRPRREGLDPGVKAPTALGGSPVSLPPPDASPLPSSLSTLPPAQDAPIPAQARPYWTLAPNSPSKAKALAIVAQRAAGLEDEDIAKNIGISVNTIRTLLFRAGKNGWLSQDATLYDPKDRFEYQVGHKVVRNLEQALDSDDPRVRAKTAMHLTDYVLQAKTAEGVVGPQLVPPTMIAIRVEQVNTGPIREGTVFGVPAFVDGETVDS